MKHTNTPFCRLQRIRASAIVASVLCVLAPAWANEAPSFAEMIKNLPLVPVGPHDSEMLSKVTMAVGFDHTPVVNRGAMLAGGSA